MNWSTLLLGIAGLLAKSVEGSHTFNRLDSHGLSPGVLRLRHGHSLHLYHNYTILNHGPDNVTVKYLERSRIPYHDRVLQYHDPPTRRRPAKALSKRAFYLNPDFTDEAAVKAIIYDKPGIISRQYVTWAWKRSSPSCPVIIYFSFVGPDDERILGPILKGAFKMWW